MADPLTPWWVAVGTGAVGSVIAVIAKVWAAHRAVVGELRAELASARLELAEANKTIVQLQQAATQRGDEHQREHLRDLRRLTGLSDSLEPPPPGGGWPPVIIREAPARRVVREPAPLPGLPPRKLPRTPR